jgi:hypothetical protein
MPPVRFSGRCGGTARRFCWVRIWLHVLGCIDLLQWRESTDVAVISGVAVWGSSGPSSRPLAARGTPLGIGCAWGGFLARLEVVPFRAGCDGVLMLTGSKVTMSIHPMFVV